MLKTTFKVSAILLALTVSATNSSWAELNPQEVKTTYLKNCSANGGVKEVCQCSYAKALQVISLSDMATINTQMSSGITDTALASRMERVTNECAMAVKVAKGDDASVLPPPPPPPMPDLQPVPDKQGDAKSQNYMAEIKEPAKLKPIDDSTPGLSKNDQAKMDQANGTPEATAPVMPGNNNVAQPPVPPKPPVIKTAASATKGEKKPKGGKSVFGQYDRMFFDAAARGDINALRAYATKVRDFDVKNENGDTALIVAISYGQAASVDYLIGRKADVNLKNLKGQAPIHIAAYTKRPDLVEALINAKANPNVLYGAGYTPLVLATMQQDLATVQVLLAGKAKVNQTLTEGNTELHVAAVGANPEIIQLLVQAGGKVNQKNKAGYTPLMVAAYSGNTTGVQALLQLGADPKIKDKAGRTALMLAQAAGYQDAFNVLMSVQQ